MSKGTVYVGPPSSGVLKINAIKAVRQHLCVGLAEAKALVEQAEANGNFLAKDVPLVKAEPLVVALRNLGLTASVQVQSEQSEQSERSERFVKVRYVSPLFGSYATVRIDLFCVEAVQWGKSTGTVFLDSGSTIEMSTGAAKRVDAALVAYLNRVSS